MDLEDLMKDALILAKNEGMDVFNALEQMKNMEVFDALKFGKGDGNLQYYLYNWCCPVMESKDVGIVLL
jgi:glycylpeptide N-tetradecanoyltransferase